MLLNNTPLPLIHGKPLPQNQSLVPKMLGTTGYLILSRIELFICKYMPACISTATESEVEFFK